jgi:hypothetical protein
VIVWNAQRYNAGMPNSAIPTRGRFQIVYAALSGSQVFSSGSYMPNCIPRHVSCENDPNCDIVLTFVLI